MSEDIQVADAIAIGMRFNGSVDKAELLMTDLMREVLEKIIAECGTVVIKIKWFSKDLEVIIPDTPVSSQEASQSTEESESYPN